MAATTPHTPRPRPWAPARAALAALVLALAPVPLAPAQDAPAQPASGASMTSADSQAEPLSPAPETDEAPALRARPLAEAPPPFSPLGSVDDASPYDLGLEFTPFGAGISGLWLTHDHTSVERSEHIRLQSTVTEGGASAIPFSLLAVEIDARRVSLAGVARRGGVNVPVPVWEERAPGHFTATIEDDLGQPVARIDRRFVLPQGSHAFTLKQTLTNLTDAPITVRWIQTGPVNLPKDSSSYGGDKRRFRYGYITTRQVDLAKNQGLLDATVSADHELNGQGWVLGKKTAVNGVKRYETARDLWPNDTSREKGRMLVWAAVTDRYFSVAVHPLIDPAAALLPDEKVFKGVERIERLVLNPAVANPIDAVTVLELISPARRVAPGATDDASMGVYAGPVERPRLAGDPMLAALGLDGLVVYNFGGPCAFCTFPWLTHLLLVVLRFNHSFTGDWALAIIVLVIMVRTALHPVTRWSQIRVQRFGAQMQAIAPKQTKIRERYKDDPKKVQAETAKLWREEGISPAGMLGCLPLFLQSPVWIALYATLFFAAELRHEPAFYGVFQTLTGGNWQFLADLSAPDQAIPLPSFMHFSFPLWGSVTGINLVPILMGFVFYVQQKYLMPPPTATLSPEQEQQQKIMKFMMVVMFPIFMYAAPSGLAIYFVTSSVLGILESRWIRAHMNKHGLLDPEKIKAQRSARGPGFLARLQQAAQRGQEARNAARGQGQGFGSARARQMTRPAPKKVVNRQYKKKRGD